MIKKSGKIGQSRGKRSKIKFGGQFPSKHASDDRIHQITLHYKRNLQTIAILLLFSPKSRLKNLRFRQDQSRKIVPPPHLVKYLQLNFMKSCMIGSSKRSKSFMAIIFLLAELFEKIS